MGIRRGVPYACFDEWGAAEGNREREATFNPAGAVG